MAPSHHVGNIIRSARTRLRLDDDFCARQCGLSSACYDDVEAHKDEFFTNISLGTARRICRLLNLDLLDLAATFLRVPIADRSPADDAQFWSRNGLVSNARLKKRLSEKDLGDAIGFEAVMIESLERTPDFIETLPINVVVDIARTLDLDPGRLICHRL